MVTYWEDEATLVSFAGKHWDKAGIPKGMESSLVSFSVEPFYIEEMS